MSKFKIKMKLQGLELEMEGSRDDMRLMSQNLGQQMAGLLQPAGAIIEGDTLDHSIAIENPKLAAPVRKKTYRRKQSVSSGIENTESSLSIDWKHDSTKYGTPKQAWKTAEKSLWTIYVVGEVKNVSELSSRCITETFNKHFKQAGPIIVNNVARDLGKLKVKKGVPAAIGEDTTKNPSEWFLTDEGRKQVQKLIADACMQRA